MRSSNRFSLCPATVSASHKAFRVKTFKTCVLNAAVINNESHECLSDVLCDPNTKFRRKRSANKQDKITWKYVNQEST